MFKLLGDPDSLSFELFLLIVLQLLVGVCFFVFAFLALVTDLGEEVVKVGVVEDDTFGEPGAVVAIYESLEEGVGNLFLAAEGGGFC